MFSGAGNLKEDIMTVSKWMTAGTVLKMMAMQNPDKPGAADKFRKMTFKEWNDRSCRFANALNKLGVKKGERFAILAYNCVEWLGFYAGSSQGGQVTVPVMFRLAPPEIEYVVKHSDCKAFFVAKDFVPVVNSMRRKLPDKPPENYVYFGDDP